MVTQYNVKISQCNTKISQCNVWISQCNAKLTQCNVQITQRNVLFTQCNACVSQCNVTFIQCNVQFSSVTLKSNNVTGRCGSAAVHTDLRVHLLQKNLFALDFCFLFVYVVFLHYPKEEVTFQLLPGFSPGGGKMQKIMQEILRKQRKKKKFKDVPKFDRPREKMLAKGPAALSNLELLAVLLANGIKGRDVFKVAQDISTKFGKNFKQISLDELQTIKGVGKVKSCQIMAALEFSRRFLMEVGIQITNDIDLMPLIEELRDRKQEYFLTFTLDGGNYLIEKRTVFIGTLNQSFVHPREIFADAITDRAASIIFVHNHPIDECYPSTEDILVTNRLREVAKLVGIQVLDHIIISKTSSFSFKNKGLLTG